MIFLILSLYFENISLSEILDRLEFSFRMGLFSYLSRLFPTFLARVNSLTVTTDTGISDADRIIELTTSRSVPMNDQVTTHI